MHRLTPTRKSNIGSSYPQPMLIVITFIPAKETCYQMMIASQVTDENIQSAEDVIKKSVDYIFEKLKESD